VARLKGPSLQRDETSDPRLGEGQHFLEPGMAEG
jgi:hypothetical protein